MKGDIVDVVISDLHIGNPNSTLSSRTEEIVSQFVAEVNEIDSVGKLILLGDVFDFWDENLSKALKKSSFFFEKISEITKEVIYIPGNHDHHSLILCEKMELINKMEQEKDPDLIFRDILRYEYPKKDPEFTEAEFLKGLLPGLHNVHLKVIYPEYTCKWKGKEILFRHGHYLDSGLFRVMPWLYEFLGGKIKSERDFEVVNTPVYEYLYYCGTVREISDFYKRLHHYLYRLAEKFYRKSGHKTIESRKKDIERFFKIYRKGQCPDILVFGHTHVVDRKTLFGIDFVNSGCWIKERNIPHVNTYVTIGDEIEIRKCQKNF